MHGHTNIKDIVTVEHVSTNEDYSVLSITRFAD